MTLGSDKSDASRKRQRPSAPRSDPLPDDAEHPPGHAGALDDAPPLAAAEHAATLTYLTNPDP